MNRICVVMPGYHHIVHEFCNRLSSSYKLTLILPEKYCPTIIEGRKYDVYSLPSIYLFGELAISFGLLGLLRKIRPNVIITGEDFQPNTLQIAFFQRFTDSKFVVISEKYFLSRVNYLRPFHKLVQELFTKPFVWRRACKILARSWAAYRYALKNGAPKSKIDIIHMGIETPNIDSSYRSSKDSILELLSVGRLIPLKGYPYLFKALAELKNEGIIVKLTIVGEEHLQVFFRDIVVRLGLESQIIFKNQIPHSELMELYKEYDIYIQPSIIEVVGLAALEALASGRALIVSDVGGLADIVEEGKNGFRVPTADAYALADAIKKMHLNRSMLVSMQRESLRLAEEKFSWYQIISSYVAVIDTCIESKSQNQDN